jgi:DNA primase
MERCRASFSSRKHRKRVSVKSSLLQFNTLKKIIPIPAVLDDKGLLDTFKRQGDRLVGPCPLHGGDNPNAFVVSLSKNLWYCFTGCNGGDIVDLVRRLDGKNFQQTLHYLRTLAERRQTRLSLPPARLQPFKPFVGKLPLDHRALWLQHKGITPQTAALFDVGAYCGKGFLADSIAIRLHDVHGHPLGYLARRLCPATINRYGKYQFPPAFPKSTTLYNYYRLARSLTNRMVITECPWGVMRLHQLNIPAVALLGIQLSANQCALVEHVKDIVLMLDGDDAGMKATRRIKTALQSRGKNNIHPIFLPAGADPDDLADDELRAIVKPFFF